VLIELSIVAFGAKNCGSLLWGFYDLLFTPVVFIERPWLVLAVLASGLLGIVWRRLGRYQVIVWALLGALLIAVPTVTAFLAPLAATECGPV